MLRLDSFIGGGDITNEPPENEQKDALVFAESNTITYAKETFSASELVLEYTEKPYLPPNSSYRIIFALSENDLDNILICLQAKRLSNTYAIALCSERIYQNIFEEAKIEHIVYDLSSAFKKYYEYVGQPIWLELRT